MMAQVEEYASGEARDPFLALALKPAETLTPEDTEFLLRHSFYSDPGHMIYRYPRYGELFDARNAQTSAGGRNLFSAQELRDVQMWSQLAWFDEFRPNGPVVREWIRGRSFTLEDQRRMGEKQREIIGLVLPPTPNQRDRAIEISTTPYYHRSCLCCDSNIAAVAHPAFRCPALPLSDGARRQLELARNYVEQHFGVAPVGLWPSEGSVSDEVFTIASELGFEWAATDSGVLDRTQQRAVQVEGLYRPYAWRQGERSLRLMSRDHFMSDLTGFVYPRMEASHAAAVSCIASSRTARASGEQYRDAQCPIIWTAKTPGILRPQRPPLPARALSPHQRRWRHARRDRQRGLPADRSRTARPHFSRLVDQREFRYLDRGRGRQSGLDAVAARPVYL
jgi:alpha-amylase/alpha-mannosidase (GH57 family)